MMASADMKYLAKGLVRESLQEVFKQYPKMTDDCRDEVNVQIARIEKFLGFEPDTPEAKP